MFHKSNPKYPPRSVAFRLMITINEPKTRMCVLGSARQLIAAVQFSEDHPSPSFFFCYPQQTFFVITDSSIMWYE